MARADAIEADFVRGELPPDSTTFISPVFLGPDGDVSSDGLNNTSVGEIAFLKFDIPDIAEVASIDTFDIFVTVFDDADGGGESGDIDFALPGNNVQFLDTFTSLNHTTETDADTVEIKLTPQEITEVFPSLSDGTFRIRVSRDTGDFYLAATGSAIIDGELVSEPSSASMMAAFCVASALLYLFRKFKLPILSRETSVAQI